MSSDLAAQVLLQLFNDTVNELSCGLATQPIGWSLWQMACFGTSWLLSRQLVVTQLTGWLLVQVYCLPDMYEVEDRSLDVIRHVLNPLFKPEEVRARTASHRPGPDPFIGIP